MINSICCLKEHGVIIIDDVLPNSYHASLPDPDLTVRLRHKYYPGSTDYSWMGDVYKCVFFIRNFIPLFSYATISDNHGQIVMWRLPRDLSSPDSLHSVAAATFETIVQREDQFNLMPMSEIMEKLRLMT